ncbi:hypothetical protein DMA15_06590 [Streptomyces sp. WAC 01529]|uniref:PDZ domain-containing protein n=1 Tax=Streptomyces sp. WAC 01529 TaxID=2203205 RepID=UPI000F70274C|nr:PDZ domain-containing protein [Streptomyces sp. WAC 01529]AZM52304.1 hypothetical protein DMA15_06590 [Streptomyces sp. WAC 01529]
MTTLEEKAIGSRQAFASYVAEVLATTLAAGTPMANGSPLHPHGFRLRNLFGDEPVRPLDPRTTALPLHLAHLEALLTVTSPLDGGLSLHEGVAVTGGSGAAVGDHVEWDHRADVSPDFVFSYPVAEPGCDHVSGDERPPYPVALLTALLDSVELCDAEGREVFPDALRTPDGVFPIAVAHPRVPPPLGHRSDGKKGTGERQPLHSVAATEATIVTLARHWGLLAPQLTFRHRGERPCTVDGFRLRDLKDWVIPADGHPAEVYEYLARVCNVSCEFCYLYGNPQTLAVARGQKVIKDTELETRLRYYDPKGRSGLFHAQWEINEFLVDPKVHQLLPALRERTDDALYFITNGSPLNGRVLDLLEGVQPAHLIVSINSLDEDLRGSVMNERSKQTGTALTALRELAARKIPYGISLAAFPDFPIEDLRQTIKIVDGLGAGFVRVNLPGHTRNLPYQGSFDTDELWTSVMRAIRKIRTEVSVPVFSIPSALEENHHTDDPLAARVVGTVPNSPAARAGLRSGDVIRGINGFPVRTRADVVPLLMLLKGKAGLLVEREGEELRLDMAEQDCAYPYAGHVLCKYLFPWGVVVAPCLSASAAAQIRSEIDQVSAGRTWMLTSALMRPAAEALFRRFDPELLDQVEFVESTNEFLGGNIRVMDMSTIGDICQAIEARAVTEGLPDLILMAETGFNRHGRDLQGRHWRDIERHLGRPVRLIRASRFTF